MTLAEKIAKLDFYMVGTTHPDSRGTDKYKNFLACSYYHSADELIEDFSFEDYDEPDLEILYDMDLENLVDRALQIEEEIKSKR